MRRARLVILLVAAAWLVPFARAGSEVAEQVTDSNVRDIVNLVDADDEIELNDDLEEEDDSEAPCDSPDSSVAVLLNCIRAGTWTERLLAVEWLPDALGVFDGDATVDQQTLDAAIDLLIQIVHDEPDDWIARSLLEMLDTEDGPGIDRLFRAALREASINLRAMGVRHLEFVEDPEALDDLEDLWRSEVPDWLRRSLIVALADQPLDDRARRTHLREFIDLITHADPEIRLAAIEALGSLGDAEAEPALLRAARRGPPVERAGALDSLAMLPVTEAMIVELERALQSDDRTVRRAAIRALDGLDHPGAEPLLVGMLQRSADASDLAGAAGALERSKHPEATTAIAAALGRLQPPDDTGAMKQIVRVLQNRDDGEALPWLGNLSPGTRDALGGRLTALIDYLSRDRATAKKIITVTSSCGGGYAPVNPDDPRARRISPEPPFETVRCWEAPSVAGESWTEERPAAGTLVMIDDYFERPGETWVMVFGHRFSCWMPLDDLVAADTPPPPPDPARRPRIEFDLPAGDVDSNAARHLIDAGLLEILEDRGDGEVVAAALGVDPADPDQVALLDAVSTKNRGPLDSAIRRLRRACCAPLP